MSGGVRCSRRAFLGGAAASLAAGSAGAQPAGTPSRARLIGGALAGEELIAGVEITLQPGWKTYWRVPGDSGLPPRFDLSRSANLRDAEVLFPAPDRLSDGYGDILGYTGAVVFPVRLRPGDPRRAVAVVLGVDYGVCERVCIPVRDDLRGTLGTASPPAAESARVAAALARVPAVVEPREVLRDWRFDPSSRRLDLVAALEGGVRHVVVEGAAERPQPLPALSAAGEGALRATLTFEGEPPPELRVTVVGERRAVETRRALDG